MTDRQSSANRNAHLYLSVTISATTFRALLRNSVRAYCERKVGRVLLSIVITRDVARRRRLRLNARVIMRQRTEAVYRSMTKDVRSRLVSRLPFRITNALNAYQAITHEDHGLMVRTLNVRVIALLRRLVRCLIRNVRANASNGNVNEANLNENVRLLVFSIYVLRFDRRAIRRSILTKGRR